MDKRFNFYHCFPFCYLKARYSDVDIKETIINEVHVNIDIISSELVILLLWAFIIYSILITRFVMLFKKF